MAEIVTTTGENKWIWWAVSLLGLGAIGTAVWYFFFRKESKFAQNRLKAKGDSSTNTGTNTTTTEPQPQTQPQPQSQTTQVETPKVNTQTNTNPPPKTEKPKDAPKEDKPKVLGDVFNDIYAPNAKNKITTASKNGKALMQALLNNFNDSGMIKVDGDFGPASQDAYQRAKNKLMKTKGIKYTGASTQQYDILVADMATWQNLFQKADMDDIKKYVRKVPAKDVFLS